MRFIDANIILRYILDDHAELSPKAKRLIDENIVETPIEALWLKFNHYPAGLWYPKPLKVPDTVAAYSAAFNLVRYM